MDGALKRKNKLHFFSLVLIISIGILLSGFYYYQNEKKHHALGKHNELIAIGKLRADQLSVWLNDRLEEATFFSTMYPYTQYIRDIMSQNTASDGKLKDILSLIITDNRYQNIYILDNRGEMLFSVDPDFTIVDSGTIRFALDVFNSGEITIHDFYYCPTHREIHFEIFAPVRDENQNIISVVIFRINPDLFLYPIISERLTSSVTKESYLVKRDGERILFLSPLRHVDNSKLQISISDDRAEVTAVRALQGEDGVLEGVDYRNERVLSNSRRIPNTNWYILTEIDIKELNEELDRQSFWFISAIIFLILMIAAFVSWIYHRRQRDFYRELSEKRMQLFQAQEEYGATLYSIGDGVITTDQHGNVKHLNPVAERLTGWREPEAIGKRVEEVFVIENEETRDSVESPVHNVLKNGRVVGLANHTILISKEGHETPISDSGAPIKDKDGRLLGVIMVFSDQSELRIRQKLTDIRLKMFEYAIDHTLKETLTRTLDEICLLLKSPIGFIHFFIPDQDKLWLQTWSTLTQTEFCNAEGTGVHYDSDEAGVWADAVRMKRPVVHNDYDSLPNKKGMPEGHAKVIRELVVPVIRNDHVVAVMGIGNKPTDYHEKDVEILSFLADVSWEIAGHKLNEDRLRQSEERFVRLFERAPLGYQSLDESGHFIEVNQAWTESLGFGKEEVIGKWFGDFMIPEEVDAFRERFAEFKKRGNVRCEIWMKHKSGDQRLFAIEGNAGYKDDGSFEKTHCILRDITESRHLEMKLLENERQLSSMVSNLPGFVYRCLNDKDWTMLYMSKQCEHITGYDPDDFIFNKRLTFNDIIKREYHSILRDEWNRVLAEKSFFRKEYEILNSRNEIRWVLEQGVGVYDESGNLLFLEGYIEDITDGKVFELQLRESEEKNRLIMDNSMDAILLTKPDGSIISANKAACKMFGMTEAEILKAERIGLVDMNDSRLPELLLEQETHGYAEGELDFFKKDGSRFTAEITSSVFQNSRGEYFTSMIIRDITERKRWEKDLVVAKEKAEISDRLKSAFLANMSHEIRTPMNGIIGFLGLLKSKDLDEKSKREYIDLVNKSGQRLLDTINDIIEISKIEAGEQEVKSSAVDINEIMRFHVDFFLPQAKKKGIELIIAEQIPRHKALIETDKNKLNSVLSNLVRNAIKFTAQGGIQLGNFFKNDALHFYVKDTGCGIPEDKLALVFERFMQADPSTTRAYEGSGLGLTIAKAYVNLLGGKIWVESKINEGSTFYFSIPYKSLSDKYHVPVDQISIPQGYSSKMTILIAEDDDTSFQYLKIVLKKRNITPIRAVNGKEAVRLFMQRPDISLILMDIKMPVMDGLEATREIRAFNKTVPIIAQTAFALSGDEERTKYAGCNDYLSKPIKPVDLFEVLDKYLM